MQSILLQAFLMIFLAEMGDKSQLLTVAMGAEYRLRDILIGLTLAATSLNLLAVTLGAWVGEMLPHTAISLLAGGAFLLFAVLSFGEENKEGEHRRAKRSSVYAVWGTYFLAELGDKTQLSALTLTADGHGEVLSACMIFLGATIGLLLADLAGLIIGLWMKRRLQTDVFCGISAIIFLSCGALRLLDGFLALFDELPVGRLLAIVAVVALTLVATLLCVEKAGKNHLFGRFKKRKEKLI